jgi:hypothetical protein
LRRVARLLCVWTAVAILAAGVRPAALAEREVIDRIMAVVSGQPIMLSDVNAALDFHLVSFSTDAADPVSAVLDRLIDRTLMLAEVERYQPPEPAPGAVSARMADVERQVGSEAAFERDLAATGQTREQLRRYVRDDLRIAAYLEQRFGYTDRARRDQAIADWVQSLRKRSEVSVLYLAK